MPTLLIVGGSGRGSTVAAATTRAQWDTGVLGAAAYPILTGPLPAGTAVRVLTGSDPAPTGRVRGVYPVHGLSRSTAEQVWVALAWGERPDRGLVLVSLHGDSKGVLVGQAHQTLADLELCGGGVVLDGGFGALGAVYAVCLAGVLLDDPPT